MSQASIAIALYLASEISRLGLTDVVGGGTNIACREAATEEGYRRMLTVKHISNVYVETVYEACRVTFDPGWQMAAAKGDPAPTERVHINGPDGPSSPLETGTVYVMNDKGATVSKYDLNAGNAPETSAKS